MLKLTRIAAIALIALAVLLAVVAFVIGRKPAASADNPSTIVTADAQTFSVVEATARLPAGEPISANGVRLTQRTTEVPGAVADLAAVVGKVPVQDISEGSAIGASLLAQGFSLQLRPGERALAVPVDELVAAGNRILPGDFVDVFLNLRSAATSYNGQQDIAQTRLLLSRLRVLSYGQQDIAVAPGPAQVRHRPRPATTHARPISPMVPAAATATETAAMPRNRHAPQCWRYRWPTPTACCSARSRASCSWPCAIPPIPACRTWRCSRRRAACLTRCAAWTTNSSRLCSDRRTTPTQAWMATHWLAAAAACSATLTKRRRVHRCSAARHRDRRASRSSVATPPPPVAPFDPCRERT